MAQIELSGWKCERCAHIWVSRQDATEEPRVCPKCKSPYWNRPRKIPKKKKDAKD
jgi:predicted Zn-ribbon and HTH transcriptional regulator